MVLVGGSVIERWFGRFFTAMITHGTSSNGVHVGSETVVELDLLCTLYSVLRTCRSPPDSWRTETSMIQAVEKPHLPYTTLYACKQTCATPTPVRRRQRHAVGIEPTWGSFRTNKETRLHPRRPSYFVLVQHRQGKQVRETSGRSGRSTPACLHPLHPRQRLPSTCALHTCSWPLTVLQGPAS